METKALFDNYERVEDAAKELIRAVVWEDWDFLSGGGEGCIESFLKECQNVMVEPLVRGVLNCCMCKLNGTAIPFADDVNLIRKEIVDAIKNEIQKSGRLGYCMDSMAITNRYDVGACFPYMCVQSIRLDKDGELYAEVDVDGEKEMQKLTEKDLREYVDTDCLCSIYNKLNTTIHYRKAKLDELRSLVWNNGRRIVFDGSFTFLGNDYKDCIEECVDVKLMELQMGVDGGIIIKDVWQGDEYTNDENFIEDSDLDKVIEYVKKQTAKKKYCVQCTRIYNGSIEIEANSKEEAIQMARENYDDIDFQLGETTADYADEIE